MTIPELIERVGKLTGADREIARFDSLSFPEPMSGCWIWEGTAYELDGRWRPYFFMQGKQWLAHRASVWLHRGPFDLSSFICHRCDNPLCVNPDHLYVGDHASNMRDMARRKRAYFSTHPEEAKRAGRALGLSNTWARGSGNPRSKLTQKDIDFIRSDPRKTKAMADLFGVARTTIQRIRNGTLWRQPLLKAHSLHESTR